MRAVTSLADFLGEKPLTVREQMDREHRWVCWKIEQRGGKPTKPPYNPLTGTYGKSDDPTTWGWLTDAERAVSRFGLDGIGFVLGGGWAGIDIDGPSEWKTAPPRNGDEAYARRKETYERLIDGTPVGEWIRRIGGLSEFSPNLGVKIIIPDYFQKEADAHKNGGGLEFYASERFFTITGDTIADRPQVDLDAFRELIACRPPRRSSTAPKPASSTGTTTPYGAAALRPAVAELRSTPEGDRNNALNIAAFTLGQLIAGGELDEDETRRELAAAAFGSGLEPDEIRPTLDRALRAGMAEPRAAPPRTTPTRTRGAPVGQVASESSDTSEPQELLWDDPVPFPDDPSADAPLFPIGVFPAQAQRVARTVSAHAQAPLDLAASNMLGTISAALLGKAKIETQVTRDGEEPVCWFAPALPSGERKTTTQRLIVRSVYEVQRERMESVALERNNAEAEVSLAESAVKEVEKRENLTPAELAAAFAALDQAKAKVPGSGRIIADDLTPEGLLRLFEDSEQVFIAASEGGLLDTLTGIRYGKIPNLDLLNKSHDGDPHSAARASNEHRLIERPLLAMVVSPQPDVLRELAANETLARRGTLARFLFTLPPSVIGTRAEKPTPIDSAAMGWWKDLVRDLFAAVQLGEGDVRMLPQARRIIEEWRRPSTGLEARVKQSEDARLRAFRSRLHGEVYRLAALLHFLEHGKEGFSRPIGITPAEGAVTLGNYYEAHAEIVYSRLSGDERMEKAKLVLAWLEARVQNGEFPVTTVRDVHRAYGRWSAEEVRAVLAVLEGRDLYRVVRVPPGPQGGRPSEVVARNPWLSTTELTEPHIEEGFVSQKPVLSHAPGDSGLCCEDGCTAPGSPVREAEGLFCTVHAGIYGLHFLDEEMPEERASR